MVVRVRPTQDPVRQTHVLDKHTLQIKGKTFAFDRVAQQASQEDMFLWAAKPIAERVLQGYNGTVFAYGQTASGKTHTMSGNLDCPENMGLIPRTLQFLFESIEEIEETVEKNFGFS